VIGIVFVEEKPMEGRELQPEDGAVIGREGTDIVLADPEVSRRHAAIRGQDAGAAIEDLGSTNGTFVNDERIEGVCALRDGDVVRLGNTVWRVRASATADAGAGATAIGQVPVGAPQVTAARPVPVDVPPAAAAPPPPVPAAPAPAAPAPAPAAAAPAAPQAPAEPAAPSAAPVGRRGDVEAPPEVAPSAIRRVLPPTAPGNVPAFTPPGQRKRGSAATRVEATVVCLLFAIAVAVAVAIYFASQ
jgi:predicted component of type VI protein secretion system